MNVTRILETCIYAADLDAAEAFYRDVMGLTLHSKVPGRHVFFRCGKSAMFLIFNPDKTMHEKSPHGHGKPGSTHAAFAVEGTELDAWRAHFAKHNVAIELETTWPNGSRSIYFRDPAGNSLELAPPDMWGL